MKTVPLFIFRTMPVKQQKKNNTDHYNRYSNAQKLLQLGVMAMYPYHCVTPVQVRYTDYDMQGHVNNSIYFNFFDLAKMDYFKKVRGNFKWEDATVVVASMKSDYLAPTFYYQNVEVETQTLHIGIKSITLLQQLVDVDTRQVKCVCQTVMVNIDHATGQSTPISEQWREALCRYEDRCLTD